MLIRKIPLQSGGVADERGDPLDEAGIPSGHLARHLGTTVQGLNPRLSDMPAVVVRYPDGQPDPDPLRPAG
jgi:hypothetical protein